MLMDQMGTRWTFPDLRREMNRVFDQVMAPLALGSLGDRLFPAINVWGDGDRFVVEAEVPGVALSEIEINVVGGELSIKGSRKPTPDAKVTFHRQERPMGEFSRSVTLPVPIDADKVQAVLKNGILTITLPKAEAAKPRRIQVQSH